MKSVNLPLCLEKDSVSVEADLLKTVTAFGYLNGQIVCGHRYDRLPQMFRKAFCFAWSFVLNLLRSVVRCASTNE